MQRRECRLELDLPEILQHDARLALAKALLRALVEQVPAIRHRQQDVMRAELEVFRNTRLVVMCAGRRRGQHRDEQPHRTMRRHLGNAAVETIASKTASVSFSPMNVQMK